MHRLLRKGEKFERKGLKHLFFNVSIIKNDILLLVTLVTEMKRKKQEAKEKERKKGNVCRFI